MNRSNDILKLIDAIGDGHHVYSGMVHQGRAIEYLTQALSIADEIEKREYQNAKRIDELNHIVESYKFQYEALCYKHYAEKDALKSENAELENANRIVQAELKRQYERVDALTEENKLLSDRVKEQNDIIDSLKKQYQILCDKHYANLDELKQLRKSYFELKADQETVHVVVRCDKCK